jgi:hypothetical protein
MRRFGSAWLCACAVAAIVACAADAMAAGGREEVAFADDAVGRMQKDASAVRAELQSVRSARDIVKTDCVNDKLAQLETALRGTQDARATLRRASMREDQDAIAASATKIRAFDTRARQLRAEADQCIGEELAFRGGSEVVTTTVVAAPPPSDSSMDEFTGAYPALQRDVNTAGVSNRGAGSPSPASPSTPTTIPPPSAPFAPTPTSPGSTYASDAPHEAAMLAYTADMTLAVFEVTKQLAAVEKIAADLGGYLSQRNDMQITVRIPRPRFADAMQRVEKLGDVLHRNVSAEDVTDEYVDLELRLKNARETRDRLAELLKMAMVKDAVEIEKELAKVTEVVEQIEGRLKLLRDRVGYSTLTVSFQQTTPASAVRSTAILPFTWLDTMGLAPLLNVPKVPQ